MIKFGLKKLLSIAVVVSGWTVMAGAQEQVARILLFDSKDNIPPVILESDRGWIPVSYYDWENPGLNTGSTRRWRLESSYQFEHSGNPVTIQVRLKGSDGNPVFTHPWSQASDSLAYSYSNWYEDPVRHLEKDSSRGLVEARLVAPPRTPVSATLFSVVLEAWDTDDQSAEIAPSRSHNVNLAFATALPETLSGSRSKDSGGSLVSDALGFSLSFVDACLTGNLPEYYRMQADPVRSLEDGLAMTRYRLSPPQKLEGVSTLYEYKQRFDYNVFPVSEIRDLFPEWFDEQRPWIPSDNAYLFLGHNDKFPVKTVEDVNYLVFMVEPDSNGDWHVIARPHR